MKKISLTFGLKLSKMTTLPKVLILCARLGGNVDYISAAGGHVTLSVTTSEDRKHRFAPQLRRIIDVTSLVTLVKQEKKLAG